MTDPTGEVRQGTNSKLSPLKGGASLEDGVVTARGTGNGLVIRLDGRVKEGVLKRALHSFVESRSSFLSGNDVQFEWVGAMADTSVIEGLKQDLEKKFNIKVVDSKLKSAEDVAKGLRGKIEREPLAALELSEHALEGGALSPVSGSELLDLDEDEGAEDMGVQGLSAGESRLVDAGIWDDPDARVVYKTIRSGQRVETEHTLVIVGDVNSGAELIAGGDIIVLGTLRGVAHAGAYDETGGGRFIFSLHLEPSQLRIGSVISRGEAGKAKLAEIARVEGSLIVVEPFQAKSALGRMKRAG